LAAIALVVAPSAFRTAPSREAAGALVGESLRSFGTLEAVFAVTALVTGVLLQSVGAWGPRVRWIRMSALVAMAALLVCYSGHVHPEMARLRGDGSPSARERFDRLHRTSVRLVGAPLLGGRALLGLSAAALRSPDGG
jgi:hypothetical protein